MGHHHHFHMGHIFHDVFHIVSEVAHVVGGPIGEVVGIATEGESAVEDFKHHHDIAGAFAGAKAIEGGASLLGL